MSLKNIIKKIPFIKNILVIFTTFGLNPVLFFNSVRNLPRFIRELFLWKKNGGKITHIYPILSNYQEESGSASSQYFHQDLQLEAPV